MHYLIVSFSHKNTTIDIRERLSFGNDSEKISFIKSTIEHSSSINEMVILSTCNRVEIIASVNSILDSTKSIIKALHKKSQIDINELDGRADIFEDSGAVHHLFSVSSSLDSMVIGETQITGQLKDAFRLSYENGFAKLKLPRVMHYAFKCAATVRNSTDISKNSVSVSSTAVLKAKELLGGSLGGFTAVVVGSGEMAQLLIKSLLSAKCNVIMLVRDISKGKEIAKLYSSDIVVKSIDNLESSLNRYRLLFSATSSKNPIITDTLISEVGFDRYWFDIAVPRDIDIENSFNKLNIYSVDDLKDIVHKNISLREEQAKIAYAIVGQFSTEFFSWLNTLSIEPFIKELRVEANRIKNQKIDNSIKKGYIKNSDRENIDKLVDTIFNQFLHTPTNNLRKFSKDAESDLIIESMKRLFDISLDSNSDTFFNDNYKCEKDLIK
jgi:glutamyl-tRNA reductase